MKILTTNGLTELISKIKESFVSQSDVEEAITMELADIAVSGDYDDLTNVPNTFTPSTHTHAISDVTDLTTTLNGKQATISDLSTIRTGAGLGATALQPPLTSTSLPTSGTALSENTVYNVSSSSTVGTYVLTPPANGGWAHGTFYTGSTVAITFASGSKFIGSEPEFEVSKQYEFDVEGGVWAVVEVVSA